MRLGQVRFGQTLVPGVEIERGQTVVAGEQKLRLTALLGQAQRLLVLGEGLAVLTVALMDLAEDDQRHGQVIEQPQTPVEVDGGLRRFHAFGLAPVGQRAVGHGEVGVEARLKAEVADLLRGLEPPETGLDAAARIERAVQHP